MKTAADYCFFLGKEVIASRGELTIPISAVTNDSRCVVSGGAFVAINGTATDGHEYIAKAVGAGASLIIYTDECEIPESTASIQCRNGYHAYGLCCSYYHDHPASSFRLIGVTGTNGKTTTAFLMEKLLLHCGANPGLISTVVNRCVGREVQASHTTPEAGELTMLFSDMAEGGCDHVVMEVSSHGLHQRRSGAAGFDVAIFTNLTGDHLDYHGDMEQYFAAKSLLFTDYLSEPGVAVINVDDSYGRRLVDHCGREGVVSFGYADDAVVRIESMQSSLSGIQLTLRYNERVISLSTNLIGEYNGYNCVGVFCAALALGIDVNLVCEFFSDGVIHSVPGRVESYLSKNGARIIVDYAHTDDALSNVLSTLRPLTHGQLVTVFGCGGDRDRTKRPRMARAACQFSDKVIITTDNPRTEDSGQIFDDILTGVDSGIDYSVVSDRKLAIKQSIAGAGQGDCVLIAGKGHEDYQILGREKVHFSDVECVVECIRR